MGAALTFTRRVIMLFMSAASIRQNRLIRSHCSLCWVQISVIYCSFDQFKI
jgi:hypothetical protein